MASHEPVAKWSYEDISKFPELHILFTQEIVTAPPIEKQEWTKGNTVAFSYMSESFKRVGNLEVPVPKVKESKGDIWKIKMIISCRQSCS